MKKNERLVKITEENKNLANPVSEYLLTGKSLRESIEEAKVGKILAAREILEPIAFLLSTKNADRNGKPYPVPNHVRDYLSEIFYKIVYRKNEEEKEDVSTNRTPKNRWLNYIKQDFYLTKSGAKFKDAISDYEKRLVADLVFQIKNRDGCSLDKACEKVTIFIYNLRKEIQEIKNKINKLRKKVETEKEKSKKRNLLEEIGKQRIALAKYANFENVCKKFQNERSTQDGIEEIKKWYYEHKDQLETEYRSASLIEKCD
jgi:hypothetical protein